MFAWNGASLAGTRTRPAEHVPCVGGAIVPQSRALSVHDAGLVVGPTTSIGAHIPPDGSGAVTVKLLQPAVVRVVHIGIAGIGAF